LRTGIFFLYIYYKSLIQSKVAFFKSGPEDQIKKCSKYCVIKCVKTKRVLKGNFASSIFHSCNAKMQMTQNCVTGPRSCIEYWSERGINPRLSTKASQFMILSRITQRYPLLSLIRKLLHTTFNIGCYIASRKCPKHYQQVPACSHIPWFIQKFPYWDDSEIHDSKHTCENCPRPPSYVQLGTLTR
jgi:hypothetical protein